ncbi:hypothetical protein POVCU2_0039470 [Plasmodium ovale curtisi]|uniref:Uncharacterized protein n=1 Tax=Plasmodium ovale curtisi TaxID=864141 RepID=A0A1A8W253_PLAOA|nr:hypothetical protein POVCU2_0039470 [Plasmodium ovale curtisi]
MVLISHTGNNKIGSGSGNSNSNSAVCSGCTLMEKQMGLSSAFKSYGYKGKSLIYWKRSYRWERWKQRGLRLWLTWRMREECPNLSTKKK